MKVDSVVKRSIVSMTVTFDMADVAALNWLFSRVVCSVKGTHKYAETLRALGESVRDAEKFSCGNIGWSITSMPHPERQTLSVTDGIEVTVNQ